MKLPLYVKVVPVYAVISLLLLTPFVNHYTATKRARLAGQQAYYSLAAARHKIVPSVITGVPSRIVIPSLGIDLAVTSHSFEAASHSWPVTDKIANFASESAPANNQAGQPFLYGHWSDSIFGQIKKLQPGDWAYVYTDNGHLFAYQFQTSTVVSPTATTQIYDNNGPAGLKIMTCYGHLAQQRLIAEFRLEQSS